MVRIVSVYMNFLFLFSCRENSIFVFFFSFLLFSFSHKHQFYKQRIWTHTHIHTIWLIYISFLFCTFVLMLFCNKVDSMLTLKLTSFAKLFFHAIEFHLQTPNQMWNSYTKSIWILQYKHLSHYFSLFFLFWSPTSSSFLFIELIIIWLNVNAPNNEYTLLKSRSIQLIVGVRECFEYMEKSLYYHHKMNDWFWAHRNAIFYTLIVNFLSAAKTNWFLFIFAWHEENSMKHYNHFTQHDTI